MPLGYGLGLHLIHRSVQGEFTSHYFLMFIFEKERDRERERQRDRERETERDRDRV